MRNRNLRPFFSQYGATARQPAYRPRQNKRPISPIWQIVADGDSIPAGYGVTTAYPSKVHTDLSAYYDLAALTNLSVSGDTLANLITRQANTDAVLGSGRDKNILIVHAGTNDMHTYGISGETTYSRLVTYCKARKGAGWWVVVVNCLPRETSTAFEERRSIFNSLISANYLTFAHALADVAGNDAMGDYGDVWNQTYYQIDRIHPNQTGANLIAGIVKATVERIL